MKKETMTLTRGLAEVKLLDERIEKAIHDAHFLDVFQNRRDMALKSHATKGDFTKKAAAAYQSITDMIERRRAIKSAILRSNAETKVKIAGETYLVTEAIARKNSIGQEQSLLVKMRQQWAEFTGEVEKNRVALDKSIEDMLKVNLGADKKVDASMYDAVAKPFIEQNELRILDPVNVAKKVEDLDNAIAEFLKDVDFVLSESNAKNEIHIG